MYRDEGVATVLKSYRFPVSTIRRQSEDVVQTGIATIDERGYHYRDFARSSAESVSIPFDEIDYVSLSRFSGSYTIKSSQGLVPHTAGRLDELDLQDAPPIRDGEPLPEPDRPELERTQYFEGHPEIRDCFVEYGVPVQRPYPLFLSWFAGFIAICATVAFLGAIFDIVTGDGRHPFELFWITVMMVFHLFYFYYLRWYEPTKEWIKAKVALAPLALFLTTLVILVLTYPDS